MRQEDGRRSSCSTSPTRFVQEFERPLVWSAPRTIPCDRDSAAARDEGDSTFSSRRARADAIRTCRTTSRTRIRRRPSHAARSPTTPSSAVRLTCRPDGLWCRFNSRPVRSIRCHMHILLLSAGGGGGNILRSVKAAFRRDLAVTQKRPEYSERLRRSGDDPVLGHDEFALSDLPKGGARASSVAGPRAVLARGMIPRSRSARLMSHATRSRRCSAGTRSSSSSAPAESTGSGTMFPLAQIARQQRKLVIPIFVRPSFERHEVDKRHYDHAVRRSSSRLRRHSADRDPERPRLRGTRSGAATDRLGANECPDCARAARADLRPVGSLEGRSVRPLDSVCRSRPSANRLRAKSIRLRVASRDDGRWSERLDRCWRQSGPCVSQARGHIAGLHPGRLVESRGRKD